MIASFASLGSGGGGGEEVVICMYEQAWEHRSINTSHFDFTVHPLLYGRFLLRNGLYFRARNLRADVATDLCMCVYICCGFSLSKIPGFFYSGQNVIDVQEIYPTQRLLFFPSSFT